MRWCWLLLACSSVVVAMSGGASAQVTAASRPAPASVTIEPMAYPDPAAAGAAWRPMGAGVAEVEPVTIDGVAAVRFPCNFTGTTFDRASWDHVLGPIDLTDGDAITFRFRCDDRSPIATFNIYLQSGDGWYAASFAPPAEPGWATITVPKAETTIEGTPAGWSRVRTVRLSAWRGTGESDTSFAVADLRTAGGTRGTTDPGIAIVRGESAAADKPDETESVQNFTATVAGHLRELGVATSLIGDGDLSAEVLARQQVVILPHNPTMPDAAAAQLAAYVRGGGRVVAFYQLPPVAAEAIGVRVVGYVAAERPEQFAAMRFVPDAAPRGAPEVVRQRSWNVQHVEPIDGAGGRVAAWWADADGKQTPFPAVVLSDGAAYVSHVLLNDDPENQRRMLLALLGHLEPRVWEQAAGHAVATIGRFGPFANSAQAFDKVIESGALPGTIIRDNGEAGGGVTMARQAADRAAALVEQGKYLEAIAAARDARERLRGVYYSVQQPVPNEFRAAWCHSAFGPDGMGWDAALKVMADNGFTAILPNMLWGGVAYYPSEVLPVAPEVAERGDQLAACIEAAKKHGIEVHVWKVNWNMGSATAQSFVDDMKRQGRTQVNFDGSLMDRWLCPSDLRNQQLEIDAMVEVATKYDVDGIHFDYIRYPGPDACFCPNCRKRFETRLGRAVRDWPGDVRADDELNRAWNDFRRENITKVVAGVWDKLGRARRTVKLSAAVFSSWPADRDNVAQDWRLWCERGYVDFVCPMDYTPHAGQFDHWVSQQKQWAGKVPVYPGIGLSVWPARDVPKLIEQIQVTRRHNTGGFTIFEYQAAEARDVLPMLGKGTTRAK